MHRKYIKVSYIAETFAAEWTDPVVQIQLLPVVVLGPHVGAQLPTHKIYKGCKKSKSRSLSYLCHPSPVWSLVSLPHFSTYRILSNIEDDVETQPVHGQSKSENSALRIRSIDQ